ADSRQIYVGMDIGTAKPAEVERSKVKHLLIDIVYPDQVFTAAEFLDAAKDAINFASECGKNALIVGGTGLYVRALVEGFDLAETPPVDEIRDEIVSRLEEKGLENLANELHQLDPEAANEIDLHNPHRVIRALEIVKATGKPLKQARGKTAAVDYEFSVVGLRRERESLNERIRNRTYAMINSGWIDEVRELMKSSFPENSPAMSGIGYMEIRQYLKGEITKEMAIEKIIIRTRQYAKRQMTWFNSDDYIQWVDLNPEDEPRNIAQKVYNLFMGG
ncbi:tRNA (adenosine(37)-N6)-dimethylallyltransferase MiaA, partial [bacterium]|nr:tRNA (adenosine(37)-N6)-dimethylallyltransferase MiaA [bacterium]MBU1025543.1 tRNA (adenosine(37)-N6)-dimethylallyltransferase MiaA [bacterium]